MAVWDSKILWGFVYLLAGAMGEANVNYPYPVCAVNGSTVTLPCSFTPLTSVRKRNGNVRIEILRVVWCKNHEICQGTTPTEYDSKSNNNNPRYSYLGDKKGNCTLQITDLQKEDSTTLRFRMEANDRLAHFTGREGVNVTVIERPRMKIKSSSYGEFKRGETVTLDCTTMCTIHQLNISWFRDGYVLQETSSTLQLGALTAKDSGNYTCNLKENLGVLSQPYSLRVAIEEGEGEGVNVSLIVGVVFGVLLALLSLILVSCIIRKKRASANPEQPAVGGDVEQKTADYISYTHQSAEQKERGHRQEPSWAADDVSYAPVQFKPKQKNETRQAEEAEDAIIYSSIVSRG